jgi:DNA-directed RNA polymerase subunit RPC12/RpoP
VLVTIGTRSPAYTFFTCRATPAGITGGDAVPADEFKCLECVDDVEIEGHAAERDDKAVCPECDSQKIEALG